MRNTYPIRNSKRLLLFVSAILSIGFHQSYSQESQLSLERIFSSSEFYPDRFGPARWLNKGYTTLEPNQNFQQAYDIILYDVESGNREVLISANDLIPDNEKQPLIIQEYEWSPDENYLLIFTNTARVWRYNTKGDYWVFNRSNKTLKKLGGSEAAPSTLMFAKFSPQNDRVAYVREHNIYVESIEQEKIISLTDDGTKTLINGTFDWVYEEEFGARDGFRWSPDGKHIAYWQLDASKIGEFLMINNTDSVYSHTIPLQYPKVGYDNSLCRIGVVSTQGGETTWINIQQAPQDLYLPRMEWADNNEQIIIQKLNRKQNTNQVLLSDIKSGNPQEFFTEKDSAWVQVVDDWQWLEGGNQLLWISEKDGWRHVYQIDRKTRQEKLLTPFEFDVISLEKTDLKHGYLYYIASPENATQRYLYRSKINGKGKPERVSPQQQSGTHQYQISSDASWAIHTYSEAGVPPVTDLVSLPQHKSIRTLVSNSEIKEALAALPDSDMRFFQVSNKEGISMDAYMMLPPNFDSTAIYPVLFHVYGEPAGQTVLDSWGGSNYLWHRMLAEQGYIIMSIDNQGTPAPKGRHWRKSIYEKIGIIAPQDQAEGIRKIIQRFSFVDTDRIGVWGWSGGGSMTLNAMFRYPNLYKMGMSVAPVAFQMLYDNVYQERYMGLPWENKENYLEGSPVTHAKNLKGDLLIVHGTGDDNVHYQNTELLVNELIRHNKYFSMMSYPNRSHGIYEGENTSRHLRELLTRYLQEHLPAGQKNP